MGIPGHSAMSTDEMAPGALPTASTATPNALLHSPETAEAERIPVAPTGRWYQFCRVLGVAGIIGLTVISVSLFLRVPEWKPSPLRPLPAIFLTLILIATAYHPRTQVRLITAAAAFFCSVLAILGLLPLTPEAPWAMHSYMRRIPLLELEWRVAIGPTLFAYAAIGAFTWLGIELRRLRTAADLRGWAAPPTEKIVIRRTSSSGTATAVIDATGASTEWDRTVQHGHAAAMDKAVTRYIEPGVLRLGAALPIFVFGLSGLLFSFPHSHSSYPFPEWQGLLFLIPVALTIWLMVGLLISDHVRYALISCGASAILCVAGLSIIGAIMIFGFVEHPLEAPAALIMSLLIGTPLCACLYAAVALVPIVLGNQLMQARPPSHLLPRARKPKPPPEEDLDAPQGWDEAANR